MDYELKTTVEDFGHAIPGGNEELRAKWRLNVCALADLERTIDDMFVELERRGEGELLQELCPYFGAVWPGARALVTYLAGLPAAEIAGRRIHEVGCGLALPGMLAMRAGGIVSVSDCHPDVPQFLNRNLALNDLDSIEFFPLDWRSAESVAAAGRRLENLDWLIGSDVLYDPDHPSTLAAFINRTLERKAGSRPRATITDPGRPWLQDFSSAMRRNGWKEDTTVFSVADPRGAKKDVFVLSYHVD